MCVSCGGRLGGAVVSANLCESVVGLPPRSLVSRARVVSCCRVGSRVTATSERARTTLTLRSGGFVGVWVHVLLYVRSVPDCRAVASVGVCVRVCV